MKDAKQQFMDAMMFRHACKIFDDTKKISDEDFSFLLEVVRVSPSSFGFEPWKLLVLQNPDVREKLLPAVWGAQRQLPTCSHYVVFLARKDKFMRAGSDYIEYMMHEIQQLPEDIIEGKRKKYQTFQESDFEILDERAMFDWACRQCYIALGNMMTAAAAIGIDSCPVEGFAAAPVQDILVQEGLLDAEDFGVAVMCAFGYRVRDPREKTRKAMEDIVTVVE